jgi:hypothetical protein
MGLDVVDLDTGEPLPAPVIPEYAHPDIRPLGE